MTYVKSWGISTDEYVRITKEDKINFCQACANYFGIRKDVDYSNLSDKELNDQVNYFVRELSRREQKARTSGS